ncbi:BPSL0761 family protein [Paraburkholderia phenoliruptrix]|uniref:BPSL0761 family protein n=1 Tax=Paraburkholderia phenoliruptrix TaxID=252970 RepID=UPI002869C310|nr:BPSL0761 family protein [Paraburkholderia phenoliruptrix]WMY11094.1 hypothetical protein P3F88_31040 [Paraburkholderia phenoliruptrix]
MTTPEKRTASVLATRDFLKTLAEGTTYEVPGAVRALAKGLLISFPTPTDVVLWSLESPEIWGLPDGSADAS